MKLFRIFPIALAAVALLSPRPAQALPITGSVWENDFSNNADVVPGGTPDLTFTITGAGGIDYDSSVTGYTIGGFLNNVTFNTGAAKAGDDLDNVHIQFTGQTFLNAGVNSFVVPHDDGLRLVITGIGNVLDVPGPTSPVDTPFNVTAPSAGLYSFVLDYNECCGAPARLAFEVNGAPVGVPDGGATASLLGLGLAGLGIARRKLGRRAK